MIAYRRVSVFFVMTISLLLLLLPGIKEKRGWPEIFDGKRDTVSCVLEALNGCIVGGRLNICAIHLEQLEAKVKEKYSSSLMQ